MHTTHITSLDGTTIPVAIRQSLRAKRITVRINQAMRHVELVYPKRASLKRAMEFLHSRQVWISQRFARLPEPVPFIPGNSIPILGDKLHLHNIPASRGSTYREGNQLVITCLPEFFSRRVWDYVKKLLLQEIRLLAANKAAMLGVKVRKVSLRDTRSRWGSCSSSGNLSFSTRLVFAPREVVDYLVSHEVAHLREMNHSRRFWNHVATLCPEYKTYNLWLKRYGDGLYVYG